MSGNRNTRLDPGSGSTGSSESGSADDTTDDEPRRPSSGSGPSLDPGDVDYSDPDDADPSTPTDQEPTKSTGGTSGEDADGDDSAEEPETGSTTETSGGPDRPATQGSGPALDPGTVDFSDPESESDPDRPATQKSGPAPTPSGPGADNPPIPGEVDPTRDQPIEGTDDVTVADDQSLKEQFAQQYDELTVDEIQVTEYDGEQAFFISDPKFVNKPITVSELEGRFADQLGVDEGEIETEEQEGGGFAFTANAADLYEQERAEAAEELGVKPQDIIVRQSGDGVEFDVVSEVEREMAAESFQEQRSDVADELGVEPRDIDIAREDGETVFRPDRGAQEELLEERIREEEPDAENIEFKGSGGDLRATYEVDQSPGVDDVVGGVKDPVGAVKSIGSGVVEGVDPRNNKAVAAGGALVATPEPTSSAAGAVIVGAGALAGIGHELTKDDARVETATASASSEPFVDEVETPESREEFEVVEMPVDEGVLIEEQGEIPVEGRPEDTRSEFETPEEQTPPAEIETPQREDLIDSGEAEIPIIEQSELIIEEQQREEEESQSRGAVIQEETVISGEDILHPEEMRRQIEHGESEQEFERIDEEDVVTITSEDLVDPEELHQEREEELAEQLKDHEQYVQEQEEAGTGESEETEEIDDELQPLQERDDSEFEGRQEELFTFIGGTELELEDDLEMEEVSEEQLSLLEEAQSTSVGTGSDQILPPAGDIGTETPTEGVNEQVQGTAVDQMLEELTLQEQAFDSEVATDVATETATVEANALANEFVFEQGTGRPSRGLRFPDFGEVDSGGDAASASGDGSDARFVWDVAEPGDLDVSPDLDLGDLDEF